MLLLLNKAEVKSKAFDVMCVYNTTLCPAFAGFLLRVLVGWRTARTKQAAWVHPQIPEFKLRELQAGQVRGEWETDVSARMINVPREKEVWLFSGREKNAERISL